MDLIKKKQNRYVSGSSEVMSVNVSPQVIPGDLVAGRDSVHVALWQGKQGALVAWEETVLEPSLAGEKQAGSPKDLDVQT